jgi:hypothetical protein
MQKINLTDKESFALTDLLNRFDNAFEKDSETVDPDYEYILNSDNVVYATNKENYKILISAIKKITQ